MPTWPSTTISTTHLDAGGDRPSLARADIKQMADVVNELVNYGTPQGGYPFFIIYPNLGTGQSVGGQYRWSITEEYDAGGLTTLSDSNYRFSLDAGTWIFNPLSGYQGLDTKESLIIYNYTGSTTLGTMENDEIGTTGTTIIQGTLPIVVASNIVCELRTASVTGPNSSHYVFCIKVA
jgi:hypothetical protein